MAESTLQIQPARGPGRPFEKGQSGNPAGKPPGCRNHASRAAELLLDGEAEALTRKAVALALDGDPTAMRLCLSASSRRAAREPCSSICRRSRTRPISQPR